MTDDLNKLLNDGRPEVGTKIATESPYKTKHAVDGGITPIPAAGKDTNTEVVVPAPAGVVTPDGSKKLRESVDTITKNNGYGEFSSIASKSFYGINYRGFGNPIPMNKDQFGLTFFTRPKLNLSYDNISRVRAMTLMLSEKKESVPRAVRAWLDPIGSSPLKEVTGRIIREGYDCPLVDDYNPFLTILTNNLISISGWPDPEVDTYTSKPGLKKEEWSMVDGTYRIFNTFDVTATFKNIDSDPITWLFHTWCTYMTLVYEGVFSPRLEEILNNRIDYQTRIYRMTLDSTRTYVQKIAACGAAFPIATPLGAHFDYNNETPYNVDNDQISIPFRCIGVDYLDPITMHEFNELVMIRNINMREDKRNKTFIKLLPSEKILFNYSGYPLINVDTNELEIWVRQDDYRRELGIPADKALTPRR